MPVDISPLVALLAIVLAPLITIERPKPWLSGKQ